MYTNTNTNTQCPLTPMEKKGPNDETVVWALGSFFFCFGLLLFEDADTKVPQAKEKGPIDGKLLFGLY